MDMLQVSKYIIVVFFFIGCNTNKHSQDNACVFEDLPYGKAIQFKGFEKVKFDKIVIQDLKNGADSSVYASPNREIVNNGEFLVNINNHSAALIQKGCLLKINDTLKYEISDVIFERASKGTMKGTVDICDLKEYKVNNSLQQNTEYVTITK